MAENTALDISVVVPVYNSEGTLNELFERVKQLCCQYNWSFEVIFVDDRSRDKSWSTLKQLKLQYPEYITAIKLAKNSGQHSALMCGFNHIRGNWVVTIDDDLQNPPEDIANLVACQRETRADIVYGTYQKGAKKHSIIRNIGSIMLRKILENATGSVREASAFRLVNAKIIQQIRKHHQTHLYIDQILSWYSQNTATTLVQHLERQVGESGYNYSKLVSFTVGILINYTVLPLRFITFLGLSASFVSFLLAMYYISRKLFWGINAPGFTTIIVAISLSAGLILFSMGIIGEYIARLYVSQSNKPIYSIERII